ncbi:uncharacterized protein EI97DRAFT_321471 [Westerdykella ornata]|uniref:Uncharacterized protein n=1 Tax=Westerdykella ornata TaxID=318751 RepID=A0A6A6JLG4_WESOR|nr:uncharacterized protein EI97DRAFT_321471 [Westerdykella ornata]KAF2276788.1 hypothetical protein EI97DRAFT_321471 [Westerdykella ornata]
MRLKTLNGAPLQEHLDFSDKALQDIGENLPFKETIQRTVYGSTASSELENTLPIKWRRLDPHNSRLRTGWSQPYLPGGTNNNNSVFPSFGQLNIIPASVLEESNINETTLTLDGDDDPSHLDFLNHSLILHDTLLSSQLALPTPEDYSDADNTISTSSFLTTSFSPNPTPLATVASGIPQAEPPSSSNTTLTLHLPPSLTITPLSSLPTPTHLLTIYPQTPTPTLLCVLTTPPTTRTILIQKRRAPYKMDLTELSLSDPTSANFKVSFWFRPQGPPAPGQALQKQKQKQKQDNNPAQTALRATLDSLRTGDVVLLRNIVLNVFRDTVYGQALSPQITKARTTVDVLARAGEEPEYKRIVPAGVEEQFARVRRWARGHVVPERRVGKRKGSSGGEERGAVKMGRLGYGVDDGMPPDTMEG